MQQAEHFDVLILGSGSGGNLLAWHLAPSGQRVVLVERRYIGGSCPNIACMPSKNEIWSARIAHLVRHAAQFGTITGPVTIDMVKVRQRKLTGNNVFLNTGSHAAIPDVPGLGCQIIRSEWNIRISRCQIAKSLRAS